MDKISDMLIVLKNGNLAFKENVSFPYSKIKGEILSCLQKEGFVGNFLKKNKKGKNILEVSLLYKDKKPRITQVERVSRPSKRVYLGNKSIFPVKNGFGLLVLTTPKGILSGKDAKKENVGGEVLFKIW